MAVDTFIKEIRILEIIKETDDSRTFVLEPAGDWLPSYKEGQFLTLVFYTKHGEKRRSYSISSSALLAEPLSITVKKVENGEFSRLLIMYAKPGDILYTSGISGYFTLPEKIEPDKQLFFIAAGSGITPCFSILKAVLKLHENHVVLIYSNRTEADALFYGQLQKLQHEYPERFRIHFLFSYKLDLYHSRLSSWLLLQLLDRYLEVGSKDALVYLCGPPDYMRMVKIALAGVIPESNIFKESFSTEARKVTLVPEDTSAHQVIIHTRSETYTVTVQFPQTILSAAKARQIQLPYSCETGRCGSCQAVCTAGKVWMSYNEVLTEEEVASGQILICQSYPVHGDVEILV
ncbi:MAG: flavin reductase family protein [Arcticibacter sp.]